MIWPTKTSATSLALLVALGCAPAEKTSFRDDLGRPVRVERVQRIVTLAPNLTEIVYAIGSGPRIVGTDDFSNDPPAAQRLPKVGGMQPNIEKITALRPDLVLATTNGNHPNLAPALANVGIPLYVVRTDRLEEIAKAMTSLGSVLQSPNDAAAAASLQTAIAKQQRTRRRQPRVLFAVWADPLYVAGRNTFSDDLIRLAGAANAVEVTGWPQYSLESLVASPPQIVLYPGKSVSRAHVEKLFDAAPKVRDRIRFVAVHEDRFTRPGPRVVTAAAELNAIIDEWERQK
jgi:iron complex transport system substrate-binding protein